MNFPSGESLRTAFEIADGAESIRRVKQIVVGSLRHADPSLTIVPTNYFNHSYVPDMVLEWPKRGANVNRRVYLRPTSDPWRIQLDVEEHATERPMFIHLSDFDGVSVSSEERGRLRSEVDSLAATARTARSLVTKVSAVDEFTLAPADSPASQLLPPSILRGGVGVIEDDEARNAVAVVSSGFAGAMRADRDSTAAALDLISNVVDPPVAAELATFFESIWVGSGGNALEFPGGVPELGRSLSPGRLSALFDVLEYSGNEEFWRRVGESIELESFEGLNLVGEQRALQLLMSTALPKLEARTCLVTTTADSREPARFIWQVENGSLSLRGYGRQAWVANRRMDLPRVDMSDADARPSPSKLAARAKAGGITVGSVQLVGSRRSVIYSSDDADDIAGDKLVEMLDDALGSGSRVNRASAYIYPWKPLEIDYQESAAAGRPNSKFEVSPLIWTAWVMLNDLDEKERDALSKVVRTAEPPTPEIP